MLEQVKSDQANPDIADKVSITIEYQLPTFPMGFKSHLAIALLDKGLVDLDVKTDKTNNKSNIWRDGLLAKFSNDVQVLVFYHLGKQKLELKWFYPLSGATESTENLKNSVTSENAKIAESLLAEPLKTMHDVIRKEIKADINEQSNVIPILIDNYKRLDEQQRAAIFAEIKEYKKTEQEKGTIGVTNNFHGLVQRVDQRQQENNASDGSTINATQGDGHVAVGENAEIGGIHSSENSRHNQTSKQKKQGLPKWAQWIGLCVGVIAAIFAGLQLLF